ncbi:MAG: protein kinase [Candidatus Aminicenantaceae bacterium]
MKCPECNSENPSESQFCSSCGEKLIPARKAPLPKTKTFRAAPKRRLEIGTTFSERYQIIEELGKGGMGKVYKVLDQELEEKVALKLLNPEIASDEKTIKRFRNELKTARKISHKNVCRMYHLSKEEDTYYITMEYVRGEDLKSMIKMIGQLSAGKTIFIAKQICEGLREAHHLGIVHRDLKPQNIMIDKEGNARIMDFGIARSLRAKGITRTGVMIGTPEYMSPEQAEMKDVDQRSDLYSLGVILFEMVTGRVPFEGETPLGIAMKHKTEEPPEPKTYNDQIPDALSRLILSCLEKDREQRFQTADEVLNELAKLEKGIPTTERLLPKRKPITSREITVQFKLKKLLIPALVCIAAVGIGLIIWRVLPMLKSQETSLPVSAPIAKQGTLIVKSDPPGAAVYLDENHRGEIPLTLSLDPGKYSLRITKLGYEEKSDQIEIIADKTIEKNFTLAKMPGKLTLRISTIPAKAKIYINDSLVGSTFSRKVPEKSRYKLRIEKEGYKTIQEDLVINSDFSKTYQLQKAGYGWFRISAYPYAEVKIDGKLIGKPGESVPPARNVRVTEGKHRLTFILKDYAEKTITEELVETVGASETKKVHYKFKYLSASKTAGREAPKAEETGTGWLVIKAFPYAEIEIDGKRVREVPPPLKVGLKAGKHTVRFIASRLNKTHTMEVTVIKGEEKEIIHRFQ